MSSIHQSVRGPELRFVESSRVVAARPVSSRRCEQRRRCRSIKILKLRKPMQTAAAAAIKVEPAPRKRSTTVPRHLLAFSCLPPPLPRREVLLNVQCSVLLCNATRLCLGSNFSATFSKNRSWGTSFARPGSQGSVVQLLPSPDSGRLQTTHSFRATLHFTSFQRSGQHRATIERWWPGHGEQRRLPRRQETPGKTSEAETEGAASRMGEHGGVAEKPNGGDLKVVV